MKRVLAILIVCCAVTGLRAADTPKARITDGTAVVAAGATNVVRDAWLNTAIGSNASPPGGAGIVRTIVYTAPAGVTNGVIRFYAYDAGVKRSLYANMSVLLPGSGSFDMGTNVVYSGRLRVEISQKAYTNAACTWVWAVIVE